MSYQTQRIRRPQKILASTERVLVESFREVGLREAKPRRGEGGRPRGLSEGKASEKAGPQVLGRSLPPAAAFGARQDACQPPSRPEEIGSFSFEGTAFESAAFESAALEVAQVVVCSRDDARAQHSFERDAEIGAHAHCAHSFAHASAPRRALSSGAGRARAFDATPA